MYRLSTIVVLPLLIAASSARATCVDHDRFRFDHLGSVSIPYGLSDVAVSGDIACVASSRNGLHVCDVSEAGGMSCLATVPLSGAMYGVAMSGDYAYVVGENAVHVVDVSVPGMSTRCGTRTINATATRAEVAGGHLYVATNTGLMIFGLAIPCNPVAVAGVGTGLTDVVVGEGFAYVVGHGGLRVIDVADPVHPVEMSRFWVPSHTARFVAVRGDHAYLVGDFYGLDVVDISNPQAPRLVAQASAQFYDWPKDIEIMGSLVVVGCGGAKLCVFDVSDPARPLAGPSVQCCFAAGVAVSGGRVYGAGLGGNLVVQRLAENPGVPIIGSTGELNDPRGIAAAGDLVCVADGERGLGVLDATDPRNPVMLSRVNTPGSACGVVISGTIAWVADDTRGLQAVDIGDPTQPRLIGGVDTPGNARRLAIAGDLAFVADGGAGLQVVDIADPAHPRIAGAADTHGYAMDVAIKDARALVADYGSGLAVIDITDPFAPQLEFETDTPGEAWGVAVSGSWVYVADGAAGVHSVGVDGDPQIYQTFPIAGYACDITARGDVLHVSSWDAGLHVLCRYQYLYHAWVRNRLETPGAARAAAVTDRAIFVADFGRGVQVLPAHCESVAGVVDPSTPMRHRSLVVHPNPTTGHATIQLSHPQHGLVQASVYDLAGRRIRELAIDSAAADLDLVWDGRDEEGRDAAAGVYFVKVRMPEGEAIARVVRLR